MNMNLIYGDEIGLASVVLRLFLATLFGYIVGINREKKRRGAGTRTHALVCMSACLVMITSEYILARHFTFTVRCFFVCDTSLYP